MNLPQFLHIINDIQPVKTLLRLVVKIESGQPVTLLFLASTGTARLVSPTHPSASSLTFASSEGDAVFSFQFVGVLFAFGDVT